jgi:hypothetical protein
MNHFSLRNATAYFALVVFCSAITASFAASESKPAKDEAAAKNADVKAAAEKNAVKLAADRTVVCYFHRTNRCPTCQKVGGYVEESVKKGFASEIKAGRVEVMQIDFQDAKNQKLTDAYKIAGPTLLVLKVRGDKVVEWKPAPKAWSYVAKQDDFFKYVQGEVRAYLESK